MTQQFDFSVVPSMEQSLADLEDHPEDPGVQSRFALNLYSVSDLSRLLSMITEGVLALTGLERGYVTLKERKLFHVHVDRSRDGEPFAPEEFLITQMIVDQVMDLRGVFYSTEFHRSRSVVLPKRIGGARTILCFPLMIRRHAQSGENVEVQVVGAVYAESKGKVIYCNDQKMQVLSLLAGHAAMAIENSRIYQMATVDKLTDVYLRHFVMQQYQTEWRRSRRHRHALSVGMVDIDFFKQINDAHGHAYGDKVLQKVSQALKHTIRNEDVLGRYGGEEFLLILPHTDAGGAEVIANRLRDSVRETRFSVLEAPVTVSIGLATFPNHEDHDSDQLIRKADVALYQAKAAGRNCVRMYLPKSGSQDNNRGTETQSLGD